MKISVDELRSMGFQRAGSVYPDPMTTLRVQIDQNATGFLVYLMIVEGEVKKAGKTGGSLSTRMHSTFNALKKKMTTHADHPRYQEQTFKERAQATIRAGQLVEIWVKVFPTEGEMLAAESALNNNYRGEWTKEGR